jgi:hypothetical protein
MTIAADTGGFVKDFNNIISSFVIFSKASVACANKGKTLSSYF